MLLTEKVGIILLGLAFGAQVFLRSFCVRHIKKFFYISVVIIFGILSYWAYEHYRLWASGTLSKYLLPPHQSINYFISYVGTRLWGSWLISLAAAVVIPYVVKLLNERYGERFFENEEIQIIGLGIFLTGYPGFLFYLAFVLIGGLLLSTFYILFSRGRAPLYFLWLPLAIAVIIIQSQFVPQAILRVFNL